MRIGTKKHRCVGKRVQIPAYSDLWIRDARVGTIERVSEGKGNYLDPRDIRGADLFVIRLDCPQVKRLHRFVANDCNFL